MGFFIKYKKRHNRYFINLSHKEKQMSTASDKAHEAAIAALLPEYELNKSTGEVQVVVTKEKKDSDHKRWIEAFGDCI